MPPTPQTVVPSSHRRATTTARQRENKTYHPTPSGTMRRRKSRSPDTRVLEEIPPLLMSTEPGSGRRKRKAGVLSSAPHSNEIPSQVPIEDVLFERGRKHKPKARAPSLFSEEGGTLVLRELATGSGSTSGRGRKRSKSHELHHRPPQRTASLEPVEDADVGMPLPFDSIEFSRMKQEIDHLRKQVSTQKKTMAKCSKTIEQLKVDANNAAKDRKEQEKELDTLKAQSKKTDELLSNLETNLSCQICMELLVRPHGLSPCGHVLCQNCLQEWFRSAPPGEDEMFDEDEPDALIYRKKMCPCCRTIVTSRPIPVFIVKSLVSVLEKTKVQPGACRCATPPPVEDPWAGIFMDPDSQEDFWPMEEEDEDEDEEDEYDEEYDEDDDDWSFDGYGTPEEDEHYDGPYERPQWSPPTVAASLDDYPFNDVDQKDLCMLRRGATLQMIDMFRMSYTHEHGLTARVDGNNTAFLGWNIYLHRDDESGENFIDWITSDIHLHPERWEVREERGGGWTAWKLVPEGDDNDYDTSDSEAWAADEDEDEDEDF